MDTKQYVNYFDEIKDMEVQQQEVILEQAHHEAIVKMHLKRKSTFTLTLSHFLIIFIALVPPYLVGFSLTVNGIFLGLGLIVSGFVSDWCEKVLDGKILRQGLKQVLQNKALATE